jgi:hypothetical protein
VKNLNIFKDIKIVRNVEVKPISGLSERQNLKREKEIKSHYGLFGYKHLGRTNAELQAYIADVYLKNE